MKEVSILILTVIILLTPWTNDIILITLLDILIFILAFVFFFFNIYFYVGKYLRKREEENKFELLLNRIENELKKIPSN